MKVGVRGRLPYLSLLQLQPFGIVRGLFLHLLSKILQIGRGRGGEKCHPERHAMHVGGETVEGHALLRCQELPRVSSPLTSSLVQSFCVLHSPPTVLKRPPHGRTVILHELSMTISSSFSRKWLFCRKASDREGAVRPIP